MSREAARPSRAHIAVESSDEAPEAAPRAEAPAAAPAHSSRPVPARSARPAEAPAGHRQERRQQRPSRFQPIRRGSVLFDQESGSVASSASAPRTAAQPQVAQAPVVPSQPAQPSRCSLNALSACRLLSLHSPLRHPYRLPPSR